MRARRVYPRVCGGTESRVYPRRTLPVAAVLAGEPPSLSDRECMMRVYPRVCGGTSIRSRRAAREAGLSPRVRGNQLALLWGESASGSIPACAGEPATPRQTSHAWWVYPRVCGGTRDTSTDISCMVGLSPRVRGNRSFREFARSDQGSIPACAGEPGRPCGRLSMTWVYPRVCGGTWIGFLDHPLL